MFGALPRRGSISANDHSYDPYLARVKDRIDVMRNGRRVPGFIAFDCDRGWVRSLLYQPHSGLGPSVRRGIAQERILHGIVTVAWR